MRAFEQAGSHLLGGVPMTWMRVWPGGFPLYLATAHGARLTDLDGNIFTDFALHRYMLDIYAARGHYANNPEQFGRNYGSVLLGRDNNDFFL